MTERDRLPFDAYPCGGRAQQVRLIERGQSAGRAVRQIVRDTEAAWAALIGEGRLELFSAIVCELSAVIRPENAPW